MSWRTIRSFGVVCSTWMALTLPALGNSPGDRATAGSGRRVWICTGSAGVVEFRNSSARLSPDAKAALGQIAIWARDDPSRSVRLRGMNDRSNNLRPNAKLSERRGKVVGAYLERRGVDPTQVTTVGHANDKVKDARNRRRAVSSWRAVNVVTCSASPMAEAPPPPASAVEPPSLTAELPPSPPPVETPPDRSPGIGFSATVGGGLTGFVDKQARAFTGTGPSWDARITIGTRLPIAFEGAYIGSAQAISALGLDDNALLVGNGAEGALRLNLTQIAVQPYLFGGLGWTRYQLRGTPANRSSVRGSDYVLTVPFGGGVAARAGGLLLDLRLTGRAAFNDNLMDDAYANTGEDARLHSWNFGGRLGWEF